MHSMTSANIYQKLNCPSGILSDTDSLTKNNLLKFVCTSIDGPFDKNFNSFKFVINHFEFKPCCTVKPNVSKFGFKNLKCNNQEKIKDIYLQYNGEDLFYISNADELSLRKYKRDWKIEGNESAPVPFFNKFIPFDEIASIQLNINFKVEPEKFYLSYDIYENMRPCDCKLMNEIEYCPF